MFPLILIPVVGAVGAAAYYFTKHPKPGKASAADRARAPAAVAGNPRFKVGDQVKYMTMPALVQAVMPTPTGALYTVLPLVGPNANRPQTPIAESQLSF